MTDLSSSLATTVSSAANTPAQSGAIAANPAASGNDSQPQAPFGTVLNQQVSAKTPTASHTSAATSLAAPGNTAPAPGNILPAALQPRLQPAQASPAPDTASNPSSPPTPALTADALANTAPAQMAPITPTPTRAAAHHRIGGSK